MKFVHGTSVDLDGKKFELFDYVYDNDKQTSSLDNIGSGLDAEGAGIYTFVGDSEDNINNAKTYVKTKDSAYVYILNVDIEEEDLLNNRDIEEIGFEDWLVVVEDFMDRVRKSKGFDKNKFDEIVVGLEESWDQDQRFSAEQLNTIFKTAGLKIEFDEYQDQSEFNNFYDWQDSVEELYTMSEPFSIVQEAGGAESVLEYALNKSDTLWEGLKNVWEQFAVNVNGTKVDTYNKTFHSVVMDHLSDYQLTCAVVNDGRFAVIFDVDAIEIEKKIDLNKKVERVMSEKMQDQLTNLYNAGYERGHMDTIRDDYTHLSSAEKTKENKDKIIDGIDNFEELLDGLDGSKAENEEKLLYLFNIGYVSGHQDTVESCYRLIQENEKCSYHKDEVLELIDDLNIETKDVKVIIDKPTQSKTVEKKRKPS